MVAETAEDFQVWEGWVHSRMRLLVRSAGAMVDVRPWPKAFRPPPEATPDARPRCFYFMGLSKKKVGGGVGWVERGGGGWVVRGARPRCFYFKGLSKKKVGGGVGWVERGGGGWVVRGARPRCFYFKGLSKKVRVGCVVGGGGRVGWMARRSALHSLALAPDPPPPTHPLAPRPPPSPTPPAAAQPPAYSHAHNQGMIIPQSKVDLTSAVNEFAHKVRQRGAAARTQGGVCERASGFARKVRVARGGGSTQPASYS